MSSQAFAAFGTLLKMGDGVTPTEGFVTIAEVKDITGPGFAADTIEVTNHSSPSAWREYISSFLDAGEVTFDVNFLPANATQDELTGLLFKLLNRTRTSFKLFFPTSPAEVWTFKGFVTAFSPSSPVGGEASASVTIKVTGQPTFGAT